MSIRKIGQAIGIALILCFVVPSIMVEPLAAKRRASHAKSRRAKGAPKARKSKRSYVANGKAAKRKAARVKSGRSRRHKRVVMQSWREPTFADSVSGDYIDGEDLIVRRAAVDALGPFNGSVVVADPQTGRLLTVVNQRLAFNSGYIPCSTIKLVTALAALSEGLVDRNTMLRVYRRGSMNLTEALAHSNNPYFSNLGTQLGFSKVSYYARLYGLGEKATTAPDEHPEPLPRGEWDAGVGIMTSYGVGFKQSPLQLAALISAAANGGNLYYLQHPRTQEDIARFVPKLKRKLDIAPYVSEMLPGMMGAVEYGTARRANYDPTEPIFGKTGTCTDDRINAHMGWFGSFNEVGGRKLVVVVMLKGGRPVNGPVASGVAGNVYKNLSNERFFVQAQPFTPAAVVANPLR
jgi:penicillin-binding protein 2